MQYTENFFRGKNLKFHQKKIDIFNISDQNIDRGYTLEQSFVGGQLAGKLVTLVTFRHKGKNIYIVSNIFSFEIKQWDFT